MLNDFYDCTFYNNGTGITGLYGIGNGHEGGSFNLFGCGFATNTVLDIGIYPTASRGCFINAWSEGSYRFINTKAASANCQVTLSESSVNGMTDQAGQGITFSGTGSLNIIGGHYRGTYTGHGTTLTSNMGTSDVTANVVSTAGFPSSGTIVIGFEQITYTGTTSTTFTGLGRAANGTSAATHSTGDSVDVHIPLSILIGNNNNLRANVNIVGAIFDDNPFQTQTNYGYASICLQNVQYNTNIQAQMDPANPGQVLPTALVKGSASSPVTFGAASLLYTPGAWFKIPSGTTLAAGANTFTNASLNCKGTARVTIGELSSYGGLTIPPLMIGSDVGDGTFDVVVTVPGAFTLTSDMVFKVLINPEPYKVN